MSEKEDVKRSLVNQKDSHSKDAQPPEKKETTTANKDSEGSSQSTDSLTKTSVDDEYVRKIVREFMEKAKRSAELNEAKSQSEENKSPRTGCLLIMTYIHLRDMLFKRAQFFTI
ncbi:hypothetical protein D918_08911 [Trichuris suis]|nr:hypothetical protein D918_08911 [Trichuris suis]